METTNWTPFLIVVIVLLTIVLGYVVNELLKRLGK